MAGVAIVGDAVSVAGFRPLGIAAFAVDRPADARGLWPRLSGGEFAVVFVTEAVYEAIEDLAVQTADRPVPAITIVPGAGSVGGVGGAKLERAIERALGTKMPMQDES